MSSSVQRSLRPYIASSHQLNYHTEDNGGSSAVNVCAELCAFLCANGFARAAKRRKTAQGIEEKGTSDGNCLPAEMANKKVRCNGVHLGLRSLLRFHNKRYTTPKSEEKTQRRLLVVLLDADFAKPIALRHVFALLALGPNAPSFFLLPGLSASLSVPLNLPRISTVSFTSDGPPELVCLTAKIRKLLRPIELTRRSDSTPLIKTSNNAFETPKFVRPAGKAAAKRKARRK
ncbi:hypothetical protein niasHS_011141 [Heterodera schachtii]|uniref:Uncharacterized protein n=1 Tax=Heterodera schachtii TaxID=97005 RepID=A0ABD2ITL7_HETSC